jgi:hypothetical protein
VPDQVAHGRQQLNSRRKRYERVFASEAGASIPTMATNEMVRDAIEARNLPAALRMAKQLRDPLKLADAAALLALMVSFEPSPDHELVDRSMIKWIQRLTTESRRLEFQNLKLAVRALDELDSDPGALAALQEISYRPHKYPPECRSGAGSEQ